ncbi:uncharacterized protein YozE (UPF0346 family) [Variovorax paradoxus]|uniref:Uncharacterized protein YozE (UPF0346 family) n=1 Tax=Variovorax paradoxus TaxID=34073 RepID=A0AAE4C081_VARPD|nr:YozE family protein [Variovorax paradoxus]MDR6428105.1 uncharacterized protein YozE (UPF0346 family) [Variovorax paradoxus]
MAIDISPVAYAITHHPQFTGRIKHGHAQQCLAAALGYKSLAALQASPDAVLLLERETHVVLDKAALLKRAQDLNLELGGEELSALVLEALRKSWVGTPAHESLEAFRSSLQAMVNFVVANDGTVSGQTAVMNSDGILEIYVPIEGLDFDDVPTNGDPYEIEIEGHIAMEKDTERPYVGHHVDVRATLWLVRQGAAFWAVGCRIEDAQLDTNWNRRETLSLAEALAYLLDVDIAAADELTDAPLQELVSEDGVVYAWEFDFGAVRVDDEILERIKGLHGSLQVRVEPDFFVHVQGFDRVPHRHYVHGDEFEGGVGVYLCASCDAHVNAGHFDREHGIKSYERYFSDLQRWQRRTARSRGGLRRPSNAVNVVAPAALAHQAAYEASRSPFHRWLEQQTQRQDEIGDLAQDVFRDVRFPVSASSREAVLNYLETVVRSREVIETFKDSWREFSGARRSHP